MARHGGTRRRSFRQSPGQSHRPVRLTQQQAEQRIAAFVPVTKRNVFRRVLDRVRGWFRRERVRTVRPDDRRPSRLSDAAWIAKGKRRAERKQRREHLQHVRRKNGKW